MTDGSSSAASGGTAPRSLALFTDFYELTMLRAYHELGINQKAVFSLFARRLPAERNFLIAAGPGGFPAGDRDAPFQRIATSPICVRRAFRSRS